MIVTELQPSDSVAYRALGFIAERPGLTVVDLAEAAAVPRRTALDWLQKADRLGLIERRRAPHPRALARCYLTPKGEEALSVEEEVA